MWKLVREGLRCYRPVLLISWAFGVGIFLLVFGLIAVLGSVHDMQELAGAGVGLPFAILIATMVAGFITIGTERSERRVRMHALLPLPIAQIAAARVLLPTAIMLVGLAGAHVSFAAVVALHGGGTMRPGHLALDFMAVQLLFYLQLPLAVREVLDLRQAGRSWAALASLALVLLLFALAILFTLGSFAPVAGMVGGMAVLDTTLMVLTATLFCRRVQLTR